VSASSKRLTYCFLTTGGPKLSTLTNGWCVKFLGIKAVAYGKYPQLFCSLLTPQHLFGTTFPASFKVFLKEKFFISTTISLSKRK
jgi:hypothetical protein